MSLSCRQVLSRAFVAPVSLRIFDVRGRLVRTLLDEAPLAAGTQTVVWRGDDDAGRPTGSGVYFAEVRAAEALQVRKMTLVR
ncbi:MAG: FlgD immunoglobulin-like domain containing protein [Candidatus Krumholzibacteriia bacterium]